MPRPQEERAPSPRTTKAIAPHKLMRTWRYKETKHSLKKKGKSVTLNFPLSLCSFTAKDNPTIPVSPATSPIPFTPSPPCSPTSFSMLSPPPSPISPISPRIPSPCHVPSMSLPLPTSITLPPIPVNSPTHEFYFEQREGLRTIASRVKRPLLRLEDPLAYFKSMSASEKIRLPVPSSISQSACTGTYATPLSCYG